MDKPIILYRCSACGKWSHAKRKPKHHQAFSQDDALYEDLKEQGKVIGEEPGHYNRETGESDAGFVYRCGPFDTYKARKLTDG